MDVDGTSRNKYDARNALYLSFQRSILRTLFKFETRIEFTDNEETRNQYA